MTAKIVIKWKVIKLGVRKSADKYRKAIKANGYKISYWADDILDKPAFSVSSTEKKISLVNLSVKELGFENGATYRNICERAKELGLGLCPTEAGPALREQYTDQPKGECVRVAMEPIACSIGNLLIFDVGHDTDGMWLRAYYDEPGIIWYADCRFVFRLRK